MQHFKSSPAKRDLLSFVTALGRSAISASYVYDPSQPLLGLSLGMASLYGSLNAIASHWLTELPPDPALRARFGNPVFKQWHERLTSRTFGIIQCIMDCHLEHVVKKSGDSSASGCSGSSNEVWDFHAPFSFSRLSLQTRNLWKYTEIVPSQCHTHGTHCTLHHICLPSNLSGNSNRLHARTSG